MSRTIDSCYAVKSSFTYLGNLKWRRIAVGVFGSSQYVIDGYLFFGQGSLDFIAKKLGMAT